MKKLLFAVILGTLMMILAACGGNAPAPTTTTPPAQTATPTPTPDTATQDIIEDITEQLEDAQEVAGTAVTTPSGGHYTFGDNFIIWDTFEVTFGAAPSFTIVEMTEAQRETRFGVFHHSDVVRIPTSVTNITNSNAALFSPLTYRMMSAGEESPNMDAVSVARGWFIETGISNVSANDGVAPGETVDFYIHMIYTHDGDYVVTMEGGALGQVVFRFPITKP